LGLKLFLMSPSSTTGLWLPGFSAGLEVRCSLSLSRASGLPERRVGEDARLIGEKLLSLGVKLSDVGVKLSDVGEKFSGVGGKLSGVGVKFLPVGGKFSSVGGKFSPSSEKFLRVGVSELPVAVSYPQKLLCYVPLRGSYSRKLLSCAPSRGSDGLKLLSDMALGGSYSLKLLYYTTHGGFGGHKLLSGVAFLPHPGPLPLGEGATQAASRRKCRLGFTLRREAHSLAQRERARVRESGHLRRSVVGWLKNRAAFLPHPALSRWARGPRRPRFCASPHGHFVSFPQSSVLTQTTGANNYVRIILLQ
jgi:hypothetical protein